MCTIATLNSPQSSRNLFAKQLKRDAPVKEIAAVMKATLRMIYHIKKQYEETSGIPELKRAGRSVGLKNS